MSTTILCCFLISSVFCRIFLIINGSIVLIVMGVNSMQSFISCLIQLTMKSFLIRKHSVPFHIISLLLFIASCISLQMFTTISPMSRSGVFLTSRRYLLYATIIPSRSNSQLLIKTHSQSSACLIDLKFVVLTDADSFLYLLPEMSDLSNNTAYSHYYNNII